MADPTTLDKNSACPGGKNKRIKNCCSDLATDLPKVHRMVVGQQFQAALQRLDLINKKHPDRACVLALKALVQARVGETKDAGATLDHMLEVDPKNAVAISEKVMVTVQEGEAIAASQVLMKSIEAWEGEPLPVGLVRAFGWVGVGFMREGNLPAARAHLAILVANVDDIGEHVREAWMRIHLDSNVPLLWKEDYFYPPAPDDVSWKEPYDQAVQAARNVQWLKARDRLTELAGKHPQAATIWRALAIVRTNLGDRLGAESAWSKLATLDVPLDEAVEAELMAQLLNNSEPQHTVDTIELTYNVNDMEQLELRLSAAGNVQQIPFDPSQDESGEQPPRAIFRLLSGELPPADGEFTLDDLPFVRTFLRVYGKTTERKARVALDALRDEKLAETQQALAEIAGDALGELAGEKVIEKVPTDGLPLRYLKVFPLGTPIDRRRELHEASVRSVLLNEWLDTKQNVLGGKTPREAAPQSDLKIPLLARLLRFEEELSDVLRDGLNEVREKLGLPVGEPIDPAEVDITRLPVLRFQRLMADKLTDEQLERLFAVAHRKQAFAALRVLGENAVRRTSVHDRLPPLDVYSVLIDIAGERQEALDLINAARQLPDVKPEDRLRFHLQEFELRIQRGEAKEAQRLLEVIQRTYGDSDEVRAALLEIMAEYGLVHAPSREQLQAVAQQRRAQQSPLAPAAAPAPAPQAGSKIWTPDGGSSDAPASGEKPGLWLPGQD